MECSGVLVHSSSILPAGRTPVRLRLGRQSAVSTASEEWFRFREFVRLARGLITSLRQWGPRAARLATPNFGHRGQ